MLPCPSRAGLCTKHYHFCKSHLRETRKSTHNPLPRAPSRRAIHQTLSSFLLNPTCARRASQPITRCPAHPRAGLSTKHSPFCSSQLARDAQVNLFNPLFPCASTRWALHQTQYFLHNPLARDAQVNLLNTITSKNQTHFLQLNSTAQMNLSLIHI